MTSDHRATPHRASYPRRDLELASYLSDRHDQTEFHLSASECETLRLDELLAFADAEDRQLWSNLQLGYTAPLGAPWLRQAAADRYALVTDADLVCFAGAQEALYATLQSVLGAGDHAIVVVPSYQSMETLALSRCDVTGVALDRANGWSLDIAAIEAARRPNTRLIVISFPNNPTGKVLERAAHEALIALCRQHGIWLLSDEVYRLTEYDAERRMPAMADGYERGISLGVLSKAYGLPGLRIGWVACRDPDMLARIAAIRQYLSTCNAAPSEVLACIALKAGERIVARNRSLARHNLDRLQAFFDRYDTLFDCIAPEGGVVCYPRYRGPGDVEAFVAGLARDHGIVLLPASVFRSELVDLPTGHFRIGFGKLDFENGLQAFDDALQNASLTSTIR